MTKEEEKVERIRRRVKKMRAFYTALLTYLLVNCLLLVINLLTNPSSLWFIWVAAIWGVVLLFQAINTFTLKNPFLGEEWEEKKTQELLIKAERKKKKEE